MDVDLAASGGEGDVVEMCGVCDGGYLCAVEVGGTGIYQFPRYRQFIRALGGGG